MFRKRAQTEHPIPAAIEDVAAKVLDACFVAHTELGPGLFEEVYVAAVALLLARQGLRVERERIFRATFRGQDLGVGYRADLVVEGCVLVEANAVARLAEVHEAQLVTYLVMSRMPVGFLVNFGEAHLRAGIRAASCGRSTSLRPPHSGA